jgi:hypothetical protein
MSELFQRSVDGQLSEGAEKLNVRHTNQLLDELFKSRDVLGERAYKQLSSLYTNKEHYGRNVRLGMSAREAGKLVDRAQKK